MLFNRDYMQSDYYEKPPVAGAVRNWPVLTWIIVINIAAFVLQNILRIWFQSDWMLRLFALHGATFKHGFFWTVITYSALHANLWHLFLNMLVLFFFGSPLQKQLGERRFLMLYLGAAALGGALYLALHFKGGVLLGASAGGLGLLALFCMLHAEQEMTFLLFFVLPVRVKPKYILWVVAGLELFGFVFDEMAPGQASNIAYSAHLGGLLAGWIFFKHGLNRRSFLGWTPSCQTASPPSWMQKKPSLHKPGSYRVNLTSPSDLRKEIDRILDKINSQGFGALTAEEKKTLDRAREVLTRR